MIGCLLWVHELLFVLGRPWVILIQIADHVNRQWRDQRLGFAGIDR